MWILTSHSPLLADRLHPCSFGSGWIDRFFDKWLPYFVDEVRRLCRGDEIATRMHQEVVSADGVSKAAPLGQEAMDMDADGNLTPGGL